MKSIISSVTSILFLTAVLVNSFCLPYIENCFETSTIVEYVQVISLPCSSCKVYEKVEKEITTRKDPVRANNLGLYEHENLEDLCDCAKFQQRLTTLYQERRVPVVYTLHKSGIFPISNQNQPALKTFLNNSCSTGIHPIISCTVLLC